MLEDGEMPGRDDFPTDQELQPQQQQPEVMQLQPQALQLQPQPLQHGVSCDHLQEGDDCIWETDELDTDNIVQTMTSNLLEVTSRISTGRSRLSSAQSTLKTRQSGATVRVNELNSQQQAHSSGVQQVSDLGLKRARSQREAEDAHIAEEMMQEKASKAAAAVIESAEVTRKADESQLNTQASLQKIIVKRRKLEAKFIEETAKAAADDEAARLAQVNYMTAEQEAQVSSAAAISQLNVCSLADQACIDADTVTNDVLTANARILANISRLHQANIQEAEKDKMARADFESSRSYLMGAQRCLMEASASIHNVLAPPRPVTQSPGFSVEMFDDPYGDALLASLLKDD